MSVAVILARTLAVSSLSTTWIPRAIRCPRCESLAHEQVRERLENDEIAVRYTCPICRWESVRHYLETSQASEGEDDSHAG